MTTTYDTDPNTQTIAVAWASSPLGQTEREVRYGFATTSPTEPVTAFEVQPTAERVMIAAGLACGIAAAALVGVMFFADTDSAQPTGPVPGSGAGLSAPETSGASSSNRLPGPPRALPGEPLPAPEGAPSPNSVVLVSDSAQQAPADVAVPGDTMVVIDIPIPDPPEFPPDLPLVPLITSPKLNPQPEPPSVGLNSQPEPPKPPYVIDPVLPKW
jgi:hypothetical protein